VDLGDVAGINKGKAQILVHFVREFAGDDIEEELLRFIESVRRLDLMDWRAENLRGSLTIKERRASMKRGNVRTEG
jgi:hypothetical protein